MWKPARSSGVPTTPGSSWLRRAAAGGRHGAAMGPCYRGSRQVIRQQTRTHRLIGQYEDAWDPEAVRERYSEVLDQYDCIVGAWGYSQLRLKGFYRPVHARATEEPSIAYV